MYGLVAQQFLEGANADRRGLNTFGDRLFVDRQAEHRRDDAVEADAEHVVGAT